MKCFCKSPASRLATRRPQSGNKSIFRSPDPAKTEPKNQYGSPFSELFISEGQIAERRRQALEQVLLIYVQDLDPESIQAITTIWINTIFSLCSDWFNAVTPYRLQAPSNPCCFAK